MQSTVPNYPDHPRAEIALQLAVLFAALALLIAPFQSSAGLRAASLVIAFFILIGIARVTRTITIIIPPNRYLRWGVSIWALTVLAYALMSPQLRQSLESVRGQVITPILAVIVFYCLCRSWRAVGVWLIALFSGLIILTAHLISDPFQATLTGHQAAYITIGWLTTWITMLAALLPLAWLLPWSKPRLAKSIAMLATAVILVAAWLSVNRIIWLCFGVMFVIYVALNVRRTNRKMLHYIGLIFIGAVTSLGLFYFSSVVRANYYPAAVDSAASMLMQDDRQRIWKAAINVISEKPITGYGFALESGKQALSEQFADPWQRDMYRHAHNVVLNYTIQMGIPGGLALLCLFGGLAMGFFSRVRTASTPATRAVATCGLILVVGFFLRNMTDDFFSRHASLLLGALIGMLLAICDWDQGKDGLAADKHR
jgi:O-antigen ligase